MIRIFYMAYNETPIEGNIMNVVLLAVLAIITVIAIGVIINLFGEMISN